jgi:hypothetical protein
MTYLTVAYLGMIFGIGIWTWTVVNRSRTLELRIEALEESLDLKDFDKDILMSKIEESE